MRQVPYGADCKEQKFCYKGCLRVKIESEPIWGGVPPRQKHMNNRHRPPLNARGGLLFVCSFSFFAGRLYAKIAGIFFLPLLVWACNFAATPDPTHVEVPVTPLANAADQAVPVARQGVLLGFNLNEVGNIHLQVKSDVSPTLQIASYTTGREQMTLLVGCLVATGAGLVFVAPLATVPAAVGPLANTMAGAGASAVAVGEAWSLDSLLGSGRIKLLKDVVTSVDLVAGLQGALERFLGARDMALQEMQGGLDVVIAGYGFQTAKDGETCCFIDVRTLLKIPGCDQQEDRVFLGAEEPREPDLPPAYCTDLQRFLDEDGALARQALTDNAEIAAAVIAQRLQRRLR